MTQNILDKLAFTGKLLLVTAGIAAVAASIAIVILNAPESRAQSKTEALTFEVASIKPADPGERRSSFQMAPGGGLNITNVGLKQLIAFAYDIRCGKDCDKLISGGPGWINSDRFDIRGKGPQSAEANTDHSQMNAGQLKVLRDQVRQRLQALLAERFQLI